MVEALNRKLVKPLRTLWSRIRSLWLRRGVKREIDEELRFHLEQRAAALTPVYGLGGRSKKSPEFLDCESGVLDDFAHREGVYGIMARDYHDPHAVAHNCMLAFADHLKASSLQCANGGLMVDARKFGHRPSNGDDLARDLGSKARGQLGARLQIFSNGVLDVLQGFLAGGSLAAATGKFLTPDGKTLFGLDQCYRVIHGTRLTFCADLSSRETRSRPGLLTTSG